MVCYSQFCIDTLHINFSKSQSCGSSRFACDILTRSPRVIRFYSANHAVKLVLWTNSQAAGHYTVSHTYTHSHAPACPTPSLSSSNSSSLDQSGSSHAVIANWCTNPVVKYCAKELWSASKVNTCRHSSMCFASTKRIEGDGVVIHLPCMRTNTRRALWYDWHDQINMAWVTFNGYDTSG